MNEFEKAAGQLPDPFRVLWREQVSSTSDALRELAEKGMPEGLILGADEQTAGRGRRGAKWISPKGENLAFSVLLRPTASKSLWYRLSLITGLAVAEALEELIPLAEIKWPNDVLVGGRKIAGILVETGADFVIVGIGININSSDFAEEFVATSLREQCGREVSRAEILSLVVTRLGRFSENIESGFETRLRGIRERCYLTGHRISFISAEQRCEGLAKGIGPSGELLVEMNGKIEVIVQADEVRLLITG